MTKDRTTGNPVKLILFFFMPLSLIFVYRNTLQGIGYTFIPMMAGFYELIARSIISFTLPTFIGYMSIYLTSLFVWFIASVPLYFAYKKKIDIMLTSNALVEYCSDNEK